MENKNNKKSTIISIIVFIISLIALVISIHVYNSKLNSYSYNRYPSTFQEKAAFNSNFTGYAGSQTGSQLKSLIGDLMTNAKTYIEEPEKIISLNSNYLSKDNTNSLQAMAPEDANDTELYLLALKNMKEAIETKHNYWIEIVYADSGYVDTINIYYERTDMNDESLNKDITGMTMPSNCLNRY